MVEELNGVIPAAGEGTRLRPFTFTTPKQLIPLLGKPVIEYPISHLAETGVSSITIVIGYLGDLIREQLSYHKRSGYRLKYVRQKERLGIAHALHLAIVEEALDGPLIVYLGDNLLKGGIKKYTTKFLEGDYDVYLLLSRVKDPSRFGVAVVDDGKIVKLVEKPEAKISDLAVVGIYFFRDPDLVEKAFATLKPSWRGEYEITELIQWFINHGYRVGFDLVSGWWKDIGNPSGLLEALYLLLDEADSRLEGEVIGEVFGKVIVEPGAVVEGYVYGPAYIGRDVYIGRSARIEHYVSMEARSRVMSGIISRSLLLEESMVDVRTVRLVDSVIGKNAKIISRHELYGAIRATLSDRSYVEL